MHRTLVIDVPGLSEDLLGADTPGLSELARRGGARPLRSVLPAVTSAAQATFVTGAPPRVHGAVASGWYLRDLVEVAVLHPSGRLVGGDKVWEAARRIDPGFSCAGVFWSHALYSGLDVAVTARAVRDACGALVPGVVSEPAEVAVELRRALGHLLDHELWGPLATLRSTRWIADAARWIWDTRTPTMLLVTLPHLARMLGRLGPRCPGITEAARAVDALCAELVAHARSGGGRVVVLSDFAVEEVYAPVHINRALRRCGHLRVREELGREVLDPGASDAFAVPDHQVAHVYVRDAARVAEVAARLASLPGVGAVLGEEGKRAHGLDHPRSGELVVLAAPGRWFTYYPWFDEARAPAWARTVERERKPGVDPAEAVLDGALLAPRLRVAWAVLLERLGLHPRLDLVPLEPSDVRGTHGRTSVGAVMLSTEPGLLPEGAVDALEIKELLLAHVFAEAAGRSLRRAS